MRFLIIEVPVCNAFAAMLPSATTATPSSNEKPPCTADVAPDIPCIAVEASAAPSATEANPFPLIPPNAFAVLVDALPTFVIASTILPTIGILDTNDDIFSPASCTDFPIPSMFVVFKPSKDFCIDCIPLTVFCSPFLNVVSSMPNLRICSSTTLLATSHHLFNLFRRFFNDGLDDRSHKVIRRNVSTSTSNVAVPN